MVLPSGVRHAFSFIEQARSICQAAHMSLTMHRPESPLVSPRAARVKLEPDPAVPTRPTWYLPLEIVEHIYEVAVEDALNDRDKAQALGESPGRASF